MTIDNYGRHCDSAGWPYIPENYNRGSQNVYEDVRTETAYLRGYTIQSIRELRKLRRECNCRGIKSALADLTFIARMLTKKLKKERVLRKAMRDVKVSILALTGK